MLGVCPLIPQIPSFIPPYTQIPSSYLFLGKGVGFMVIPGLLAFLIVFLRFW